MEKIYVMVRKKPENKFYQCGDFDKNFNDLKNKADYLEKTNGHTFDVWNLKKWINYQRVVFTNGQIYDLKKYNDNTMILQSFLKEEGLV